MITSEEPVVNVASTDFFSSAAHAVPAAIATKRRLQARGLDACDVAIIEKSVIGSGLTARKATFGVVAALTGFTLAHALTLTAAATNLLRPPSTLIEILIALSIVITAIDNIRPFIPAPRAAVAAFFGIIHGFGFASALGVLQLSGGGLAVALVGFNLGIEVAQIAVVLVALPILYLAGKGQLTLRLGSFAAVGIGLYWVWQRVV